VSASESPIQILLEPEIDVDRLVERLREKRDAAASREEEEIVAGLSRRAHYHTGVVNGLDHALDVLEEEAAR
jgi:hypothetical protein